jgi:hypothetical protein
MLQIQSKILIQMRRNLLTELGSANVIGVAVSSREAPTVTTPVSTPQTCPESFTCPDNDGCSYTDGSRTLVLSCAMDFYGGDFANQYAESLGACMQSCAANTECVAASFVGGKGAGICYLKSTKNSGNINDSVNGLFGLKHHRKEPVLTLTRSVRRYRFRWSIFFRHDSNVYYLVERIVRGDEQY